MGSASKCFLPLTTSFIINSINKVRCIDGNSAHFCPFLLPSRTGASYPQLSKYLCGMGRCEGEPLFFKVLKDSGGEGVSHTHCQSHTHTDMCTRANRRGVYLSLWEALVVEASLVRWGTGYIGGNCSEARTEQRQGEEKGADRWGLAVTPQGPAAPLSAASGSSD